MDREVQDLVSDDDHLAGEVRDLVRVSTGPGLVAAAEAARLLPRL